MEVTVNGKPKDVAKDLSVGGLLVSFGLAPATVIVEHNGVVLKRDRLADTPLKEGDRLEIVQIVGGG